MCAWQTGYFGSDRNGSEGFNGGEVKDDQALTVDEDVGASRVIAAVDAITFSGRSLLTLAVLSGKPDAVRWVYDFLVHYFAGSEEDDRVHSTSGRSKMHQEVNEADRPCTSTYYGDCFVKLSR